MPLESTVRDSFCGTALGNTRMKQCRLQPSNLCRWDKVGPVLMMVVVVVTGWLQADVAEGSCLKEDGSNPIHGTCLRTAKGA